MKNSVWKICNGETEIMGLQPYYLRVPYVFINLEGMFAKMAKMNTKTVGSILLSWLKATSVTISQKIEEQNLTLNYKRSYNFPTKLMGFRTPQLAPRARPPARSGSENPPGDGAVADTPWPSPSSAPQVSGCSPRIPHTRENALASPPQSSPPSVQVRTPVYEHTSFASYHETLWVYNPAPRFVVVALSVFTVQ